MLLGMFSGRRARWIGFALLVALAAFANWHVHDALRHGAVRPPFGVREFARARAPGLFWSLWASRLAFALLLDGLILIAVRDAWRKRRQPVRAPREP